MRVVFQYTDFYADVVLPLISVLLVPTALVLSYLSFVFRVRRREAEAGSLGAAIVLLAVSFVVYLFDVRALVSDTFSEAIRFQEYRAKYDDSTFYWLQALRAGADIYIVVVAVVIAFRLTTRILNLIVVMIFVIAIEVWLAVLVWLVLLPALPVFSGSAVILHDLVRLITSTVMLAIMFGLDAVAFWFGKAGLRQLRYVLSSKPAVLVGIPVLVLIGLVLLPPLQAVLWIAFFVISYPLLLAMIYSFESGERFTAEMLLQMIAIVFRGGMSKEELQRRDIMKAPQTPPEAS
jgi:hypothetical protein